MSCTNLKTGRRKSSFTSESDALRCARDIRKKGRNLVPYKCNHCPSWHLRSKKNAKHYTVCNCRDRKGNLKRAYIDLGKVIDVRDMINSKGQGKVKIYRCPEFANHEVWHLAGKRNMLR